MNGFSEKVSWFFDQIVSFSLDLDLFFTENQYLNAKITNITPNWRVEFDFWLFWLIFVFFFQLATRITSFFIEHFGMRDLFGRENYEYYAKLTGRILKVEDEWIFFTYPPASYGSSSTEALDTTLDGGREARNLEGDGGKSKIYIPSTLNIDFILWHTQLIVYAVKCYIMV